MSNYYSAAKLRAPLVGRVVAQERLLSLLGGPDGAAIWIQGPAGFGKTTLAAHFLQTRAASHPHPHLWYRIDAGDADLGILLDGVFEALRRNAASPIEPLPSMQALLAGSPDYAAAYFWRAAAIHLPAPMVIVFDEVEKIPADAKGLAGLVAACEELPDGVSVIFTSRNEPPPALARLVVNERLKRIGPETLRLTKVETRALLEQHTAAIAPSIVDAVFASTQGWPAAVSLLARHGAELSANAPNTLKQVAGLGTYLEAEVMREVPACWHDDLALVALTDTISTASAHFLTGHHSILEQLDSMARKGLFVQRLEGKQIGPQAAYQLHPLVRDFLRTKLQQDLPVAEHTALLLRAAHFLLDAEALSEAVELLQRANAIEAICEAIETYGERLYASGHAATLRSWLALIPAQSRASRPWLDYWDGAARMIADPREAKGLMEMAYAGFAAAHDAVGLALAWAGGVEAIFTEYAAFLELDGSLARLETDILPLLETLPPPVVAKVILAEFAALSYRRPDASALAQARRKLIGLILTTQNRAFAGTARAQLLIYALWNGNPGEAAGQLEVLQEMARQPICAPAQKLFARVLELAHCNFTADLAACEEKAAACIGIAEEIGIHTWDPIIWRSRVNALIAQGRHSEAGAYMPLWRNSLVHESPHHMAQYQAAAAFLAAKSGAEKFAADLCAKALASAERGGAPTFQMTVEIMVAASLAELDSRDGNADALLASVLKRSKACNPQLQWLALLMQSGIAARRSEPAAAVVFARQAFRLGREHGYWNYAFWPRDLVSRACEVAIRHGIEADYAAALIRRNDLRPSTLAFQLEGWPWQVKVRTMGRFALFVGGRPVTFGNKAQKMPIRLLQAIIALGGREVSETRLSDLLWPEAEGDAAATSLGVTLHRLRRLLQADCLTRQDGRLSLDSRLVWVDVWAFERALGDSEAMAQLTVTELRALYQGAFLQDLDSMHWAHPPRQRLSGKLVAFVSTRSKQLLNEQRHDDAEQWLLAGLEIDDLVEDFYRALMRCQAARDDVNAALQTYNRCERVLAARLMMQPSAATKVLREELLTRNVSR